MFDDGESVVDSLASWAPGCPIVVPANFPQKQRRQLNPFEPKPPGHATRFFLQLGPGSCKGDGHWRADAQH